MASWVEQRLQALEEAGLRRSLQVLDGPPAALTSLGGKETILLCSNNYLGLATDPRVKEGAAAAALRWGASAAASRLVSGTLAIHRELEERLAAFKGYPAALLFGAGYLANVGVLTALAGPGDAIFSDALNHASLIDGCRLSKAKVVVYRHRDLDHLAWLLDREGGKRRLIVTDTVFSMDGDLAPMPELVELARRAEAILVVDEAHATGCIGPGGRGVVARFGLEGEVEVLIGTLGKALASYGAYVCADRPLIQYLISAARPFIFSTAPAPPAIGAALAALTALEGEPGLVKQLQANSRRFRALLRQRGFGVGSGEVQIVPLVVGDPRLTVALAQALAKRGVFVQGIRPPSVPDGTSRLRFTVMATHTEEQLAHAADALVAACAEVGIDPSALAEPMPEAVAAVGVEAKEA